MFTTSRYASEKARKAARKMAKENNEPFVSRGKHTIAELADLARRKGEERICIIEERKKQPAVVVTIKIDETGGWKWADEKPIDAL